MLKGMCPNYDVPYEDKINLALAELVRGKALTDLNEPWV
jgi:hypothetical protein